MIKDGKRYDMVNIMKFICVFLVVAINTEIFKTLNPAANTIVVSVVATVAVPFFFIATGYFLYINLNREGYVKKFIIKLSLIYFITSIVTFICFNGYVETRLTSRGTSGVLKLIFANGVIESMWYMPALIFSFSIVYILLKKGYIKTLITCSIVLFFIGVMGDTYHGIVVKTPIEALINVYRDIFVSTRNGVAFAMPFITLGALISKYNFNLKVKKSFLWVIIFSAIYVIEAYLLIINDIPLSTNMYLSYLLLIPAIFIWALNSKVQIKERLSNLFREISLWIYVIHGVLILVLSYYLFVYGSNSLLSFLTVAGFSTFIAYLISRIKLRKPKKIERKEEIIPITGFIVAAVCLVQLFNILLYTDSSNRFFGVNLNSTPTEVVGPLYKVSDEDSSVYLYGTYVYGDKYIYPLSPVVNNAIKESDQIIFNLMLEFKNDQVDEETWAPITSYRKEDFLWNKISEESFSILENVCRELKYDFQVTAHTNPIINVTNMKMGKFDFMNHSVSAGIIKYLYFIANKEGKKISYIGDTSEQYVKEVQPPSEVVEATIKMMQYEILEPKTSRLKILELWKNGDLEGLTDAYYDKNYIPDNEKEDYKKLEDVVSNYRQELDGEYKSESVKSIQGNLEENITNFYALSFQLVGGDEGLLKMLEAEGYKVQKVK